MNKFFALLSGIWVGVSVFYTITYAHLGDFRTTIFWLLSMNFGLFYLLYWTIQDKVK